MEEGTLMRLTFSVGSNLFFTWNSLSEKFITLIEKISRCKPQAKQKKEDKKSSRNENLINNLSPEQISSSGMYEI